MTENIAKQRIMDLTDNALFNQEFKAEDKGGHAGLVTGQGYIGDKICYFYSQNPDNTQEMINSEYVEKFASLYERAIEAKAPIIGIIDGEISRDNQYSDVLYEISKSASGIVPQYSIIYGKCIGGMVNLAAVSDFTIMRANAGEYHLSNRDDENDEVRFNAQYCIENGLVDLIGNKSMLNPSIKALVTLFQSNNQKSIEVTNSGKEIKDLDKMLDDVSVLFMNLADEYKYIELKRNYAPEMVTGFIKINGNINAVIGSAKKRMTAQGVIKFDDKLTLDGMKKATTFLELCHVFKVPVLHLLNDGNLLRNTSTVEEARACGSLVKLVESSINNNARIICKNDSISIEFS